ncbi:MAG: DUF11 domain-containing protein [Planctomycetaceae bacterium]|nr:DUF11 domain-containing protein [Planctomycetaceae bacterium]
MTQQSPALSVDAKGPDAVIVGKEETYQFIVTNHSSVPAEGVFINIDLPRWAENTQAPELTTGSTSMLPHHQNDEYGIFQWQVGSIAPNKSETLKLNIVVREKRPFDLNWNYGFQPRALQAKIEVQQPVIRMEFEGPNEVIWGSEESYLLRIENTGNGDAKDLELKLSTSGVVKAETLIESLKVGEKRTLDVIVEALEPEIDELQIKVEANGPYGLSEETAKHVVIKRAKLELYIDDPGMQYVGDTLDYVLIARNMGTTASLGTVVEATLPLGVKYVSSSDSGEYDPDMNRVSWNTGTLPIGGEYVCTVVCEAKREGEFRLDAKVTEKTGLVQTASATTYVDAIADVILEIEKPDDPIKVGTVTEYVVTITNRGSKAAENIDAAVYFSDMIEPIGVDGGRAKIDVERRTVELDRIPVLSARDKLTYRIKGRGLDSGNHRVKAMLVSQSTEIMRDIQVVSRFYQGGVSRASSSSPAGNTQTLQGNTSSLTQGMPLRDDRIAHTTSHSSGMATGVPSMSRPGTHPQDTPATLPSATNPLANPGLPSSQLQATTAAGNSAPVMQIPDMAFGQQPVTTPAPVLGGMPNRVQRTSSVPSLSPPPLIDVNN